MRKACEPSCTASKPSPSGLTPRMGAAHRAPRGALAFGLCVLTSAALAQAVGSKAPPVSPEEVGELRKGSGILNGYLARAQYPDSLSLLPPPPAAGSAQAQADLQIHQQSRGLREGPRWALATRDVSLDYPTVIQTFSCALNLPLGSNETPHLNMLLRRSMVDAGLATYRAKDHYQRQRPFAALKESTCAPAEEAKLERDGSYPSGHAALGWAVGMVLTSLAPERGNALLQRGHAFGQSRMVCGVHWQSDVDAGRLVGAAAVARLQAEPLFVAQAELARQEIVAARQKGLQADAAACAQEAAALKN